MALTKVKLIADGVIVVGNLHSSHGITSANIGENTNLYFTNARARSAISVSGNALSYNSSTGVITSNFEESPTFTGNVAISGNLTMNNAGNIQIGGYNSGNDRGIIFTPADASGYWHVYNDAGGSLAFGANSTIGSSEKMRITGSGNVGIGTTSPNAFSNQTSLTINGTNNGRLDLKVGNAQKGAVIASANEMILDAGASPMQFYTGNTLHMLINTSGNVGIGTTSPGSKLHVKGDFVSIEDPSGGYKMELSADTDPVTIMSDNLTGAAYGQIAFVAGNGSGSNDQERMRIDSSGNVGIGVTPSTKLDIGGMADPVLRIKSDAGGDPELRFDAAAANRSARIKFYDNGSAVGGFIDYLHNGNKMNFGAGSSSGVTMTVGDGVVGIGTTSPGTKLDVDGTIRLSTSGRIEGRSYPYTTNIGSTANATTTNITAGSSDKSEISLLGGDVGDRIELKTNSTERMRIDSSGGVGIGAGTIPADHRLQIHNPSFTYSRFALTNSATGSASGDGLKFQIENLNAIIKNQENGYLTFGTNGRETDLHIDSSGNVGIGTTSPGRGLTIDKSNANAALEIIKNNTTNQIVYLGTGSSGGTDDPLLRMFHNGTENIRLYTTGDSWINGGSVGIGTTSPAAKLEVYGNVQNNTTSIANSAAYIRGADVGIAIGQSASSPYGTWVQSQRNSDGVTFPLSLNPSGSNVGIGTTSPLGILQLNVDSDHSIMRITAGDSSIAGIDFGKTSDIDDARIRYYNSTRYMEFFVANGERMRITSAGNVGIGTASPAYKLQVSSTTFIEGTFGDPNTDAAYRLKFYDNGGVHNDPGIGLDGSGGGGEKMWFNAYDGFYWNLGTQGVKMTLTGTGKVGIGNTSPNAPLSFANSVATRKISLYEVANNNYQFYGFGIEGNTLVYSVGDVGDRHVFFAGSGTGTRNELMRINGNGNVGIGTTSPVQPLHVNGQVLFRTTTADGGKNRFQLIPGGSSDAANLYLYYGNSGDGTLSVRINAQGDSYLNGGNVGIGTTSPTGKLNVETGGNHIHIRNGAATAGKYWNLDVASNNRFYILDNGDTGVYIADGATSWTANSDESLKENIKPLENVLDKIKDYRCIEYNLKTNNDKKIGFIAQDWEGDFAPIVDKDDEGLLGMKYTETIPVLLKAIQELKAEIEELKTQINN